jgi:hypothetical protein
MIQQTRLSVDEFLALPETKPYRELIAGEVVEKRMGSSLYSGSLVVGLPRFDGHSA